MAKPRENRQKDLLRPALEDIIDLGHPLVRLTRHIDWGFLDERFASVCTAGAGQPPLPTRLMAGLLILKHMHDLSDEALCARWLENPLYEAQLVKRFSHATFSGSPIDVSNQDGNSESSKETR